MLSSPWDRLTLERVIHDGVALILLNPEAALCAVPMAGESANARGPKVELAANQVLDGIERACDRLITRAVVAVTPYNITDLARVRRIAIDIRYS